MAAVDVLLPVRDGARTLARTLDTIRDQTFRDFRCLIVDDGSTDDTAPIGRAAAEADARFVLHRRPPAGIVGTLNWALSRSEAPLVARIDADDLMAPHRLEKQVGLLREHAEVTVVSSRVRFFGNDVSENLRSYERWLNATRTHDEIVRDLFVESPLPHPSVTVRADALRAVGGYRDGPFPEDYDLWLRGWRAGWRFAKWDDVLVRIRDHSGRLTKSDARYTARAFLECKAEHIVEAVGLAGRDVIVWGAGRDGKRLAKALRRRDVGLRHLVDVAPTKVGRRMLGVEVLSHDTLARKPGCFVVVAVGVKGARAEIRRALAGWGYREGEEFVCVG